MKRHSINRDIGTELEFVQGDFIRRSEKLLRRVSQQLTFNLNSYKTAGQRLSIHLITQRKKDNLYASLTSYLELGTRHFQREYSDTPILTLLINGKEYEVDKTEKRSGTALSDWQQLYHASIILNEQQLQTDLAQLYDAVYKEDISPFWRKATELSLMCTGKRPFHPSIMDEVNEIIASKITVFHTLEGDKLIEHEQATEVKKLHQLPIVKLFYSAHEKQEDAFNQELESHLLAIKAFVIKNKEEDNMTYWVNFPALAACAYAHDQGLTVSVESEYIPSYVYKREFE